MSELEHNLDERAPHIIAAQEGMTRQTTRTSVSAPHDHEQMKKAHQLPTSLPIPVSHRSEGRLPARVRLVRQRANVARVVAVRPLAIHK